MQWATGIKASQLVKIVFAKEQKQVLFGKLQCFSVEGEKE